MAQKPDPGTLFRLVPWVAGLSCLLVLLYSMNVLSRSIGFSWDEIWDYIPSVGLIQGDSLAGTREIRILGHTVPLVSGPYQGALKTWVSAPVINLFGTSTRFIRTLNVLYGMAYLLALYWALLPVVGKRWAWVVFLSPLLDTNFLLFAPMDYGPSLFQFIFISLALGALFRYVVNFELKHYRLVWFFTGCLLAQKLTAIPIAVAIIVITIAFAARSVWKSAGQIRLSSVIKSYGIIPSLLFLIPMAPHLLYFYLSGFANLFSMTADGVRHPYFAALIGNSVNFHTMFDGTRWYQQITFEALERLPPVLFISGLATMLASVAICFTYGCRKKLGMPAIASTGVFILGFLLYPAFGGLNRPWHFFILTPLFACGFIISIAVLVTSFENRWAKFAVWFRGTIIVCLISGVGFSATHGFEILQKIENKKGVCVTSPAITDVYESLRAAGIKKIFGINYSIANPVYVLSKGSIRTDELAWTDLSEVKIDEMLETLKEDSEVAMVYRLCGHKEESTKWISWLNHEPQIFELIKRVDSENSGLDIQVISDERATDFVLIRNLPGDSSPEHQ